MKMLGRKGHPKTCRNGLGCCRQWWRPGKAHVRTQKRRDGRAWRREAGN